MSLTCAPVCGPIGSDTVPSITGPSNRRIVAVTPTPLGLYTPMFVRKSPFISSVNAVTVFAADDGRPGMNIPTDPDVAGGASGEYSLDVTTRPPEPGVENSTAPSELGTPNKWLLISSNAFDSRGDSVKVCGGTGDAHPKHRYTAVTVTGVVY